MIFPIQFSIYDPQKGNPRQIKACIPQDIARLLTTHLGTFSYFHFLRDLFEDLSKFQRLGNLVFCKPGLEDLCITWNVIESMDTIEIKESIIDGLENLNRLHLGKYRERYYLRHSIPFRMVRSLKYKGYSFKMTLKIDFEHALELDIKDFQP